jgi:hypothetical protein
MCDRLRREAGALVVFVIRTDDVSYSVDPGVAPKDFGELVEGELPNLVQDLAQKRGKRS